MLHIPYVIFILFACCVESCNFKQIDEDSYFKVIGGKRGERNEFPYMVMVFYSTGEFACGGTLISEDYVLTAAHCVVDRLESNIFIRIGTYEHNTENDASHEKINVSRIILHEGFDWDAKLHDLALIRLTRQVRATNWTRPICIPNDANISFDGERAEIAGWGSTSVDGSSISFLHTLEMTIMPHDDCCALLGRDCDANLNREKMCAFSQDKGPCTSDSGGPLVWVDPRTETPQLVGIISLGDCGRGNGPAIFSRISSYLDWIQQNTRNSTCRF